jgi:hypothetical protein
VQTRKASEDKTSEQHLTTQTALEAARTDIARLQADIHVGASSWPFVLAEPASGICAGAGLHRCSSDGLVVAQTAKTDAENEKDRSLEDHHLKLEGLRTDHAAALQSLTESSSAQLQTARDEIAKLQSDAAQSDEVGACSMRACGCAQRRVRLRCAGSPQAKESAQYCLAASAAAREARCTKDARRFGETARLVRPPS